MANNWAAYLHQYRKSAYNEFYSRKRNFKSVVPIQEEVFDRCRATCWTLMGVLSGLEVVHGS